MEVRHWEHATAVLVRRGIWYYHYFNTLNGVGQGDEGVLDDALLWYRQNGVRCRIDLSPFLGDDDCLHLLAE